MYRRLKSPRRDNDFSTYWKIIRQNIKSQHIFVKTLQEFEVISLFNSVIQSYLGYFRLHP